MTLIDGTYTTAQETGLPRWLSPQFQGQSIAFEQDFWVVAASYTTPLTYSSSNKKTINSIDYFFADERIESIGDGSLLKLTRTYMRKPTGFDLWESYAASFTPFEHTIYNRLSCNFVVPSKLTHAFYLVLPSGGDVTSPGVITMIAKWYPTRTISGIAVNWPKADASTLPTGITYVTHFVGLQYIAMESSSLELVLGPIYVRKTRYALAQ